MAIVTTISAKEWDFNVVNGKRWPAANFNVIDETGAAQTGITVVTNIYKSYADTAALQTLTSGSGYTISGNNVLFNLNVTLPIGNYVYITDITLSNGNAYRQWVGTINVTQF